MQVIYLSALYISHIADLEKGDPKKADDSIETDDSTRVEARIDLKHNFLAWQVSIHVSMHIHVSTMQLYCTYTDHDTCFSHTDMGSSAHDVVWICWSKQQLHNNLRVILHHTSTRQWEYHREFI